MKMKLKHVLPSICLLSASNLQAVEVPNVFVSGEKAVAEDVNQNFNVLKEAVSDNQNKIQTLEVNPVLPRVIKGDPQLTSVKFDSNGSLIDSLALPDGNWTVTFSFSIGLESSNDAVPYALCSITGVPNEISVRGPSDIKLYAFRHNIDLTTVVSGPTVVELNCRRTSTNQTLDSEAYNSRVVAIEAGSIMVAEPNGVSGERNIPVLQ